MLVAGALALAVGALAIVPMGTALATNIPLTTESVALPSWFSAVAPHLRPGQVVLTYPPPVTGGEAMTWQAVDSLHFALATGAGPESYPSRAGAERAGLDVLTKDAEIFSPPAPGTTANVDAVRRALAGWGVTVLVVPEPSALVPHYNRTSGTASALALFTLVMGRPPQFDHDAWVWTAVQTPGPALAIGAADFARCTSGPLTHRGSPPDRARLRHRRRPVDLTNPGPRRGRLRPGRTTPGTGRDGARTAVGGSDRRPRRRPGRRRPPD